MTGSLQMIGRWSPQSRKRWPDQVSDKGAAMHSEVSYTGTGSAKWFFARHSRSAALSLAVALIAPSLAGCTPHNPAAAENASGAAKGNEPVMLAITGYNYTNRHIGSFSVNGAGGGNIFVSTPASGGGGTTCCVRYRPGSKVRKVVVEWQTGGCYFHEKSEVSGDVFDTLHSFSHRREVDVDPAIPADPQVLEVHFYPDGGIKASITANESPPRLRLDGAREDKTRYPRCPNDKKPAE
jgi:hypothetical protein